METKCKCKNVKGKVCGEESSSGYGCTLRKGHKGKHIACGCTHHRIVVWDRKKKGGTK
jgi:hypothetical protein